MNNKDIVDGDYRFVRFNWMHADALRRLHERVHGWVPDEERFKEKYDTEPIGGDPIGYIAYAQDGKPAAYYGVFPVRVAQGGAIFIAAQSGDTMTDPSHQGRGLFTKLAKYTYSAAQAQGVAFVFGFPNKNSYPGFVKKLGWQHKKTMHAYNIIVPTFPVAEIQKKLRADWRFYSSIKQMVLSRFCYPLGKEKIDTCISDSEFGATVRDSNYSIYKNRDVFVLSKGGCKIYFKIGRFVDIGDVFFNDPMELKPALRQLRLIAMSLGVIRIRYYVTPGCRTDKAFSALMPPRDGLPYGHIAFNQACDPDSFAFSFLDYDTF